MTRAFTADRKRITALRLAAQHIGAEPFSSAEGVVQHLLAMQAQDFPGAKWSVALRSVGVTGANVERALAERQIVRSWPMRGTLHFTPAADLGWMLALTRDRMVAGAAGRHRQLGLDAASFAKAAQVAESVLSGGRVLARTDLLKQFATAGLSTEGQRGIHMLWYLSVMGLLVFGPVDGKTQTFVLLEEWVATPRVLDGEEALAEFALRYFQSHGPATVRDFSWWSSLTLTDARRGLSAVRDHLDEFELDEATYHLAKGLQPAKPAVHVLPGFDEYLLGYQDRSAQIDSEFFNRVVPGGNGLFLSNIVLNGEVVGTWRRRAGSKADSVEAVPFVHLSPASVQRLRKAVGRYGDYLAKPVTLLEPVAGPRQ